MFSIADAGIVPYRNAAEDRCLLLLRLPCHLEQGVGDLGAGRHDAIARQRTKASFVPSPLDCHRDVLASSVARPRIPRIQPLAQWVSGFFVGRGRYTGAHQRKGNPNLS